MYTANKNNLTTINSYSWRMWLREILPFLPYIIYEMFGFLQLFIIL